MNARAEITLRESHDVVAEQSLARSGEITTRVIRTLAEIEEIRPIWKRLSNHPNCDIDFFLSNLQNETGRPRPHIIVLYRDEQPVCMLVGRITTRRLEFGVGYKTLFRPQARVIGFVYGGLLGNVDQDASRRLVREIVSSLREGEADAAFFMLLKRESSFFNDIVQVASPFNRDRGISSQIHRTIVLPESVPEFHHSLSAKVRKNQKWQAKKFVSEHSGDVSVKCITCVADLGLAIKDIEAIAAKGYQRGLRVGFVDDAAMRKRLLFEVERGWLRAYLLYASGRPCAYWVGTVYGEVFHSDYMGYDPQFAKYSPGMFLIMSVVESFCGCNNGGIREINFGHGDAQYKELLGNCEWQESSVYLFSPTVRGTYLAALRGVTAVIDSGIRGALSRAGLAAKMKKLWRQRLRVKNPPVEPAG
jgi:hypothetical protein